MSKPNANPPVILAYSVADITEVTPLSRSVVYDEIAAGRLKARKRGSTTIVLAEDLNAFLSAMPEFTLKAQPTK